MQNGTLLRAIAAHGLWVGCRARGHSATLPLAELLEQIRQDAAIKDVLPRLKCSKCGGRQIGEFRIVSPDVSTAHEKMRTPPEQL